MLEAPSASKNGWELVVPYRFLQGTSSTWRINFVRYIARKQNVYSYAYDPKMTSPFDPTWPALTGAPKLAIARTQTTEEIYALADAGADRRVFEGAAGQFFQYRPILRR
ncbi:MAG: hypothetical protein IAI50_05725 [Candidatus Eremiobacteraeota bacterium]|nr:hypothetical protein [Candidatus Eremiobacteraeota bacterium]